MRRGLAGGVCFLLSAQQRTVEFGHQSRIGLRRSPGATIVGLLRSGLAPRLEALLPAQRPGAQEIREPCQQPEYDQPQGDPGRQQMAIGPGADNLFRDDDNRRQAGSDQHAGHGRRTAKAGYREAGPIQRAGDAGCACMYQGEIGVDKAGHGGFLSLLGVGMRHALHDRQGMYMQGVMAY